MRKIAIRESAWGVFYLYWKSSTGQGQSTIGLFGKPSVRTLARLQRDSPGSKEFEDCIADRAAWDAPGVCKGWCGNATWRTLKEAKAAMAFIQAALKKGVGRKRPPAKARRQ